MISEVDTLRRYGNSYCKETHMKVQNNVHYRLMYENREIANADYVVMIYSGGYRVNVATYKCSKQTRLMKFNV